MNVGIAGNGWTACHESTRQLYLYLYLYVWGDACLDEVFEIMKTPDTEAT